MATIVLAAAGMAVGGGIGGSVLGLSGSVIGRAAGAALGRAIDGRILGAGSDPVPTGRVDRFRLTGASEGAAVTQVHGRIRIAGQVIWAGPFIESVTTTGSGKGRVRRGRRPLPIACRWPSRSARARLRGWPGLGGWGRNRAG